MDEDKKPSNAIGCLVWFNISVLYSAISAAFATNTARAPLRAAFVFLAVHGGLWAIYRALELIYAERS